MAAPRETQLVYSDLQCGSTGFIADELARLGGRSSALTSTSPASAGRDD